MLQYSIYSVISPEGCASILWKTSERAPDAAEALGITAHRLKALGLVDKIVNEPVGGAHRDHKQMAAFLKRALNDAWRQVSDLKVRELLRAALRAAAELRPLHRHQAEALTPAPAARAAGCRRRRRRLQRRPRFDRAAACDRWPRRGRSAQVRRAPRPPRPAAPRPTHWLAHCERCARAGRAAACRCTSRRRARGARRRRRERRGLGARRRATRALRADGARAAACDLVLLAHHADDQAETAAAGAARRAAPAGLAAMPRERSERDGVDLGAAAGWRMPREAIEAYVRAASPAPRRRRQQRRPALRPQPPAPRGAAGAGGGLPACRGSASPRAARCAQQAPAPAGRGGRRSTWRRLRRRRARHRAPGARCRRRAQRNAAARLAAPSTGRAPAASLVERLLRELPARGSTRWPIGGGELRRYRGRLGIEPLPLRSAPARGSRQDARPSAGAGDASAVPA